MTAISVYGLTDPLDGSVRYIGSTRDVGRRLGQHWYDALTGTYSSKGNPRQTWLKSVRDRGLRCGVLLLEEFVDISDRDWIEWFWIHQGFSLGWPLTNSVEHCPAKIRRPFKMGSCRWPK